MEWPAYNEYDSFVPSGPRQQYGMYSFDPPNPANPLAPYRLPSRHPPIRRSQHHHRPRHRYVSTEPFRDRKRPPQIIINNAEYDRMSHRGRRAANHHFSEDSSDDHATLTDASLESEVSEAPSEDGFTFDRSISDSGKIQTYDATVEPLEAFQNTGIDDTTPKPSPYKSLGSTVLRSRFVGDRIAQWSCSAELSVPAPSKLEQTMKQPLFKWVYVLCFFLINVSLTAQAPPSSASESIFVHCKPFLRTVPKVSTSTPSLPRNCAGLPSSSIR